MDANDQDGKPGLVVYVSVGGLVAISAALAALVRWRRRRGPPRG